MGFIFYEVKELIENPNYRPEEALRMHLECLNKNNRIQNDPQSIGKSQRDDKNKNVTEEQLIKIIEVTKMSFQ